ncbi:recombinase family protein [Rhizobium sp. XQZ8]|uniref:recombinase family protein n=1 Tax=Rhizobium populisoli TaxID=2859785 RepID=UPI001C66F254|nr:recombinase family protein [Rhizobium populisoli]MBW6421627.1 recombinase family protein [Rhizobium populisoli]
MQPATYVAYYRVSTQKQGQSGLGLEAQRNACQVYQPIAEFIEVESGKNDEREELNKAIAFAKANKATLIVAKLDRLSRRASFIMNQMDEGLKFRCADMPDADEFQLHLFAILAQKERKMISERTKAALQAAKARGVRLGGVQAEKANAMRSYEESILPVLKRLIDSGVEGPAALARKLNEDGHRTPNGALFVSTQVSRLLKKELEK